jgi:uncharacterized protein (TIGR00375 family)
MQIIADLQLHSKYSRAVSQKMDLFEISCWASKKGIRLIATGDWTHPLWFREIKANLKESSPGIFTLKQKPKDQKNEVSFLLSTEISSIYVQGNKQRRMHNLIFSPSIEVCEKIIQGLQRRGANLMSDGRPIIGISSRDLLELVMEIDKNVLFIPAHAWTPWFSLYGSKSGFDSINECFGDLEKHIYAIETGLSSDPIMNWQIKELESRSIVSFSDAHSGLKIGREATVFVENYQSTNQLIDERQELKFDYFDIVEAIKQKSNSKLKIGYTIEFFPEEGKYHWSGHRLCNIRYNPQEIKEKGTTCPVCHHQLTVGVENRVIDLAGAMLTKGDLIFEKTTKGATLIYDKEKKRKPFISLIPLIEILVEINNNSPTKSLREYEKLISDFGTEFDILLTKTYEEIEKSAGNKLAEGIKIVRDRKVLVDPGYDGVFGKVKVFNEESQKQVDVQQKKIEEQPSLF